MSDIAKKAYERGIKGNVAKLSQIASLYTPSKYVFPTGISIFDNAMDGGLREGELVTVSGQSGQGKTTYTVNLALNYSKKSVPSLYFSYEMDNYYLNQSFQKISVEDNLIYSPIEASSGSLDFIEKTIREGVERQAVKIIFIDHLHFLIPLSGTANQSLMIGGIVRELKKMAVRNKVIIFLIAHTRKINMGDTLGLSSIRDSGLVVAESDYVMLIERLKEKKVRDNGSIQIMGKEEFTNKGRVNLAKNRRTGKMVYQDFFVNDSKFVEITKEDYGYTN